MKKAGPETCIIVPCYNEADRLDINKITQFCKNNPDIDFLFVNDGSTDNTLDMLQGISQSVNTTTYLDMPGNMGKAEAVRSGFIQAMSRNYDYIGYLDADLSTPLDELDQLRQALVSNESVDIAIGSRIKMLGYEIERKLLRHLAGRVFATMASITLDLPVYDTQCGAKLFTNNPQLRILFEDSFINKWTFDVEIIKRHLILVSLEGHSGHRIIEVPLRTWRDIAGSRVKAVDFLIAIRDMFNIARHYRKKSTLERYRDLLDTSTRPGNASAGE